MHDSICMKCPEPRENRLVVAQGTGEGHGDLGGSGERLLVFAEFHFWAMKNIPELILSSVPHGF